MSHNMAVLEVYLYLQTGTNLNPISPPQKVFSQSLRTLALRSLLYWWMWLKFGLNKWNYLGKS